MDEAKLLRLLTECQKFRKMDFFEAYPKQLAFFKEGTTKRERLLIAGNQLGKSEAGAYETACHLTGDYPKSWPGRRWDRPVRAWAAGETGLVVRDVSQKKLCGSPGVLDDFGTGYVPKDALIDKSLSRGVTDAFDTIQVRHVSGGVSTLSFKSYEQGRQKFQGDTLDFVWLDEEPGEEIYTEALTRVTATGGMVFTTFTPLLGSTAVVKRFTNEVSPDRSKTVMTIDDAKHISKEEKVKILAGYPEWQRKARGYGVPLLGSGAVFPYDEASIKEPPLARDQVPAAWAKLWGFDFGIGHNFAACLILWDRDNDVIHVHATVRVKDQLPLQHSVAIKAIGAAVPVAWPHDGTQREKISGETVAMAYKKCGLLMLPNHATFPEGGYSTEAGVLEMQDRMTTGRLKVANHLNEFFEEYRQLHRKDGLIVKVDDDILSALRVAIMMKRFAKAVPLGSKIVQRKSTGLASGLDFDLFQV